MSRALSVSEFMNQKKRVFEFSPAFADVFGQPERRGVWFVFGNSGNGKSRFILQLIKELATHEKIYYNNREEKTGKSIQDAFKAERMHEVARRVLLVPDDDISTLSSRLERKKAPNIAIIESFQYTGLSYRQYIEFKERHANKLLIFVSHVKGKEPRGEAAQRVRYDADLKIWVEGYRAFSLGRFKGEKPFYTIWEKGAFDYWGNN